MCYQGNSANIHAHTLSLFLSNTHKHIHTPLSGALSCCHIYLQWFLSLMWFAASLCRVLIQPLVRSEKTPQRPSLRPPEALPLLGTGVSNEFAKEIQNSLRREKQELIKAAFVGGVEPLKLNVKGIHVWYMVLCMSRFSRETICGSQPFLRGVHFPKRWDKEEAHAG